MESPQLTPLSAPAGRSHSEEILRQSSLLAGDPFFLLVLDSIPTATVILNANRQIVFANRRLSELLRPSRENGTVLGMRPGEALDCLHSVASGEGCGTSEFCFRCGALRATMKAMTGRVEVRDCSISRSDNHIPLHLRVTAAPFQYAGETFTLFSVTDISEEHRRRTLEGTFFHDLLNTASCVHGTAQAFLAADDEARAEVLDMLRNQSKLLVREIKTQRQISEAEIGEFAIHATVFDAMEFLHEIADLYRSHRLCRRRSIEVLGPSDPTLVRSDKALLGRVIGNMLKNALEASAKSACVTAGMVVEADALCFSVHNDSAMPSRAQMRIFNRSFSTKGPGRGWGTISIKLLGELYLGGRVWFSSDLKEGTTFHISIPRDVSEFAMPEEPGDSASAVRSSALRRD
jgi:hypothetical protein